MAYTITLTNGNILTAVPDTQLVTAYGGLNLIGKNYAGFGTAFNDDLVHMVEHFANSVPPVNPFIGQIWYDTVSNTINFWDGTQFKPISVITSGPTPPINPQQGDEWYDSINEQLYIWNGFSWGLIGPPSVGGVKEGFVVGTYPTNDGNIYYLQLYANNELLGIVSSVNLINPEFVGFGNIRPGWNFVTNPESIPSIIESGIYNVSKITLGNDDQMGFLTDGYDNGIIQINGGNVLIATNGNAAANTAAHTEWANGNIEGIVYVNTLFANNYGNLPISVPGVSGEFIFNNNSVFAATPDLVYSGGVIIVNTLSVNANAGIGGQLQSHTFDTISAAAIGTSLTVGSTLQVTGNVIGNLNLTNALNADIVNATTYLNLPTLSVPGVGGEYIYNNGSGGFAAASDLVYSGGVIIITELSVNTAASIGSTLQSDTLITLAGAEIGTTLRVGGTTTLNFGTAGQFAMPTTSGTVNGAALLTTAAGSTYWGSTNIASFTNNAFTTNGYQTLPGGLIMQWGIFTNAGGGASGTISFTSPNINFPNACLNVVVGIAYQGSEGPGGGNHVAVIGVTAISSGSFSWQGGEEDQVDGASHAYWFAIGY